jgi:dTDP-4-amino-4,6-dideoxygalactose transaminase
MAAYVGWKVAAAVTTGTHALHMAIKFAGVGRGDIVLCSDLTFSATVNPVSYENGTLVYIDSEHDTWNMDPEALETALKKYGSKVKAVITAKLYGLNEIV